MLYILQCCVILIHSFFKQSTPCASQHVLYDSVTNRRILLQYNNLNLSSRDKKVHFNQFKLILDFNI